MKWKGPVKYYIFIFSGRLDLSVYKDFNSKGLEVKRTVPIARDFTNKSTFDQIRSYEKHYVLNIKSKHFQATTIKNIVFNFEKYGGTSSP